MQIIDVNMLRLFCYNEGAQLDASSNANCNHIWTFNSNTLKITANIKDTSYKNTNDNKMRF